MTIETLENPVTGETMHVLESNDETFVIEYVLEPHGRIPLEHFHPGVEQEFAIKSGEMHITVDGEHMTIGAGETKTSPPSSMHFQWNPHDEDCWCARGSWTGLVFGGTVLIWAFGPALIPLFFRQAQLVRRAGRRKSASAGR